MFKRKMFIILSPGGKILMWLLITGSLIVSTFAEMAIYSHIRKTKISEQPINILILSEHLVQQHTPGILVNLSDV